LTVLPLQVAGFIQGSVTNLVWIPMLAFEVPLALWLLIQGSLRPPRAASRLRR
jgi:hypothetical protein